jgi:hypothetical protein
MSKTDLVELLSALDCCDPCPKQAVAIASAGTLRAVEEDSYYMQGDEAKKMYVLTLGAAANPGHSVVQLRCIIAGQLLALRLDPSWQNILLLRRRLKTASNHLGEPGFKKFMEQNPNLSFDMMG